MLDPDTQLVLSSMSEGVYLVRDDWSLEYLNEAAERAAGTTSDKLIGRGIWDIFPEAVGGDFWQAHQDVMASRTALSFRGRSLAIGRLISADIQPRSTGGLCVVFRDVQEEETTQTKLSDTLAMLGEITDSVPVLISYVDQEQRFVFANLHYERVFGRPLPQILGLTVRELFGEEMYEQRRPYVERALAGSRERYEVDLRVDGGVRKTIVEHIPRYSAQGEVLGIYNLVQDLTQLHEAEAALSESESRLALATEASQLGVWEWRIDTGEVVMSRRAREIWGFSEDGPIGITDLGERTHPDDAADVQAQSERAFNPDVREQKPYQYRIILRPSGAVRWVRAHGAVIFAATGSGLKPARYVGTMEDVTASQLAEADLRQSEARLRLALDAGRMAVWAIDAEGCVTSSPELNRLVGLTDDAKPTLDELQAQYAPGELERLQGLAAEILGRGERYFEAEYCHIRADDGSERWLLVRAEFLFDGISSTPSSIGVVFDITERKETERRLGLLAQEVDHRANNLLAVVQSALALTQAETVADFKEALTGRLSALARAHQLLAASRWVGADIHRLVDEELSPYRVAPSDRISISGPRLELAPQTAQAVAMVIHELATNAVKHGALSASDGHLSVNWQLSSGARCELRWHEVGTKTIAPPTRRGMGSNVIARALSGAINGSAELSWERDGLKANLQFPVLGK